jgi:sugar phosphate isomerase/epimerase
MHDHEPIHIYVPGRPDDPRLRAEPPDGVVPHHGPPLHPDDVTIIGGLPVTSVARTLIDLAEEMDADELRGCFVAARERGLLDPDQLAAARARVEWRSSLATFDEIAAEFV